MTWNENGIPLSAPFSQYVGSPGSVPKSRFVPPSRLLGQKDS
jgi:hypothetical protein